MIRIAIDGPGGAGKSTIARAVASRLGVDYIDTGAMYRAIGYKVRQNGLDLNDIDAVRQMMDHTVIDFDQGHIILDGVVVDQEIRTPDISVMASRVSALPVVREKLVALQRQMGRARSVIMDGRDIGTNVLPDAEYKFYMTASPQERAQRRYEELKAKGQDVCYEEVLKDINQRDHDDMTRALNPLKKAEDATELDTTGMSIEQVTDAIMREVKEWQS